MKLLLTSVGRRTYLVRYFKKAVGEGGEVHAANQIDTPAMEAADYHVFTPLIYDDSYIPFLLDYCKTQEIGLLISLFDIDLPVLSAHRREFEAIGVTVVVSDPEVIAVCNDKWQTFRYLSGHHIPVPKTYVSLEAVRRALADGNICFPVMVKPRWGMGSLAIYQADDERELEVFYQKSRKAIGDSYLRFEAAQDLDSCIILQEKLKGQEYGLDVINDLDCRYQVTVQKCKYAMRSGETDCAQTVEEEALSLLGEKLGRLLGHRGNLDVDVFRTETGFVVLEMNARFGGGYPFSHMAGVDLPQAIVNWKLGIPVEQKLLTPQIGVTSHKDILMVQMVTAPR